ncbi:MULTISPECIES: ABC transporter substrate-binding protein [Rhizobium]|uniref:ABC transporter substrate-binding protein n=1 Tax=Rhizobium aouanii TaxID=3118145 RepID=A0ABU8CJZ4_9HYPH|nr:ABC transporter substrate-binding protein [Rhizobium acaciae]MCW1750223.1 ABC transporter substrate-binding protein [Rhizobium acaciae]
MSNKSRGGHSNGRMNRRSLLQSAAALVSVPLIAKATTAWAQEKLNGEGEVVAYSWGGSYTDGLRKYVYEPFTEATGIKVVDVIADVAEPQITAMHQAGRIDWDIAYITRRFYPEMHEAGMFVPIDYSLWDQESVDGTPAHLRIEDAVGVIQFAYLLGYDKRAFPGGGPQNWVDFWDVEKFPRARGLYGLVGRHNIVAALIADGVAPKDVWPLTNDKLDRAFKKLDEIKPHVDKWWTAGGEPVQLLMNQEYAMTLAADGRLATAIKSGAPLEIVWEGGYVSHVYQSILKGGPNTVNAQKLIAFMNRAQISAGFTQGTGYPGPNTNALKYMPAEVAGLSSANPKNASKLISEDSNWLAAKRPDGKSNIDHVEERWKEWKTK